MMKHGIRCVFQMERAQLRLNGIQSMLSLMYKDHLIQSVQYALVSGWQAFYPTANSWFVQSIVFIQTVVKLLKQRWWIPVSQRNSNMTGDIYTCVSVTGNLLRVHTHNTSFFKAPYHKSVSNRKK